MANENRGMQLSGISAGADLSALQHRFMKLDAAGEAVVCGAGESMSGVLDNAPLEDSATVILMGPTAKVIAGSGGMVLGASIASDAAGKGVAAGTGDYVAGPCVIAAGENETGTVQMLFSGVSD